MSAFNYTKERPPETVFNDIQSLNKFTEEVVTASSRKRNKFNKFYWQIR